jgi:hypothetical protein
MHDMHLHRKFHLNVYTSVGHHYNISLHNNKVGLGQSGGFAKKDSDSYFWPLSASAVQNISRDWVMAHGLTLSTSILLLLEVELHFP